MIYRRTLSRLLHNRLQTPNQDKMNSNTRLTSLTVVQKQKLMDERVRRISAGEPFHQEALAQWAFVTFHLLRKPNQSTISRIIKNATRQSLFPSAIHKRYTHGICQELEAALHSWINAQFHARRCVNGSLIITKARRLQHLMNLSLQLQKQTKLMFSSGWLTRFQKRWNLKSLKSHGESGDADQAAIDHQMPLLRSTLQLHKHCDIFNADEFGHFYRMAPDRTIASEKLPGRKCEKVRLTYLACCYADGSERLPLMCIGKAKKPRCFKKQEGQQLGFDYHANKKAWITSALLFCMHSSIFVIYFSYQPLTKSATSTRQLFSSWYRGKSASSRQRLDCLFAAEHYV